MKLKLDAIKLEDITDIDWELLSERAFDDQDLMDQFVEEHYEDFEQDMAERGIDSDYYCDHAFSWCEKHDDSYIEYAFKKYREGQDE